MKQYFNEPKIFVIELLDSEILTGSLFGNPWAGDNGTDYERDIKGFNGYETII